MTVEGNEFAAKAKALLGTDLLEIREWLKEFTLTINRDSLLRVLTILRDHKVCSFRQLIDITAIDYPHRTQRFDIVYLLLSHEHNRRIRVKLVIDEKSLVPSIVTVFKSAGWYEREVFDMFGIFFANHPDLRRILTDYTFNGHPLRKDFPMTGQMEVRYDDEEKRVHYGPLQMHQTYRDFSFKTET